LLILDAPWYITGYGFIFSRTPKQFEYKKNIELINNIKYNKRSDSEKYVNIDVIKLDIKDKTKDIQSYGVFVGTNDDVAMKMEEAVANRQKYNEKQEAKKQKRKKKEVNYLSNSENAIKSDDSKLSLEIYKTLKTTGYIDTVNKVFQDDNNTLIIRGSITKLDEYTIRFPKTYDSYKKFGLGINWYVLNTYGEVLDSVFLYSYSGDYLRRNLDEKNYEKVYADAADRSYSTLTKMDVFKNHLNIVTDLAIKDEPLSIKSPKNLVKEVADASLASVIVKRKDKGHGSGFAISNDGYILTNPLCI
jgi:hypothetical protein